MIDSICVAMRRTETRIAVRRKGLVRIHSDVTLSSLKRICGLVPFKARQDLSLGMGWKWHRANVLESKDG